MRGRRWLARLALLWTWLAVAALALARAPQPADTVELAQLPREAQQVMQLIRQGGPFPYEKDGTVFFNRERLLPPAKRGYYREYTVPTPGLSHRGARRLVCGGWTPTAPDACYYTADHYASFRRVVP
ncbi:Guanyl-specific ribonuclease Sa3 [Tepidimonas sediminis]|uniref:Guanyl-specific ribonuclease Sa3 n=1 Tax=Tepidimonas sediminis TaxID=2588941 RepID=A0A554WIY6_9BURK|nr:ribonuclease domain-containing protein [Tepidimonas sediminis]TSE23549.1 Guanyl-specific ribonuclease Sa3 [Tepidimonas sediminis]